MNTRASDLTILVAEDENAVRRLVRRILTREGFTVLEAENGRVAVELSDAHEGEIHLFLTDVVMPELSGPRAAERILERRPGTVGLYMSGYAEGEIAESGELDPDVRFLEKPFDPQSLLEAVWDVLGGQGP